MTRAEQIAAALGEVQAKIADAAQRAGRRANAVRLIAVSKKMPPADVRAALEAGQGDFGENYAQELRDKRAVLQVGATTATTTQTQPRWHYLGPVQSNKVKYLVGQVELIHSVDSPDTLAEIDRRLDAGSPTPTPTRMSVDGMSDQSGQPGGAFRQACLVQVNVAGESRKGGVSAQGLPALLDRFATCLHARCLGLMLIPPAADDPAVNRRHFAALRLLAAREAAIPRPNVTLAELSMGMSGDFVEAIGEGATMVRVGTAIFGARQTAGGGRSDR